MKMSISWYYLSRFEQKFHFSSLKCDICDKTFSKNRKLITTFQQFMKEKSYYNVKLVNLDLNKNKPLSTMFYFLMKQKLNECEICDATFTTKPSFKNHIAGINEGKK